MRAGIAHGCHQIMRGGVGLLNQVGKNLGIGLAPKDMTTPTQLLTKLGKILDNAVMDNGDTPIAAHVRMSVLDRWASMRRPSRMANTTGRGRVMLFQLLCKACDLAHFSHDIECAIGTGAHFERHSRRVVTAIFKTSKTTQQDIAHLPASGVADDSAHIATFRIKWTAACTLVAHSMQSGVRI